MPHRSSAAAIHAARTVLKYYNVTVIPREQLRSNVSAIPTLEATDGWVSIIIDWVTQAFEVANLRPELTHWIKQLHFGDPAPGQLVMFVRHMIERMERVPKNKLQEELEKFTPVQPVGDALLPSRNLQLPISTPAKEATNYLFAFYWFAHRERKMMSEFEMQLDVAKWIHVSIGLHKAMPALKRAKECEQELSAGRLTLGEIKAYFREFGVCLEQLPNYQNHEEETKLLV